MSHGRIKEAGDKVVKVLFGKTREEAKAEGVCIVCGKKVNTETDFKDDLSRKEYGISAMCQNCQDEAFEGGYWDAQ